MKVFIIPPSPWLISDTDLPMLGILYIAAVEDGILCDLTGNSEYIIPEGDEYWITCTTPQFKYVKEIVKVLKPRGKRILIGGPHATALPEYTARETGTEVFVGAYPFDIDTIPRRDLLDDRYTKAQTFSYLGKTQATMMTSFGCAYSCNFCASRRTFPKVQYRSKKSIEKELDTINADMIEFVDDSILLNNTHLRNVCEAIDRPWHCLGRADEVNKEKLELMTDSNCLQICIGYESGSDHMLGLMNKRSSVETYIKSSRLINEYGIKIKGQLIVGYPGETQETVDDTLRLIDNVNADKWAVHFFQPIPGSKIWKDLGKPMNFDEMHTIGKMGEYKTNSDDVAKWYDQIKQAIGEKSIEK